MIKTHQKPPEDIDFRFIDFIEIYGNANDCFGRRFLHFPFQPLLGIRHLLALLAIDLNGPTKEKHNTMVE